MTPSDLGITAGCEALEDRGRAPRRAAILFTDGATTSGADSRLVGPPEKCFIDNGWAIYSVGIGNYNEKLLQKLAMDTGGTFHGVSRPDGAFMICEVQAVRSELAGGGVHSCTDLRVYPGQTVAIALAVPDAQRKATFSLNWIGKESDVELRLLRPSGTTSQRTVAGRAFLPADIQVAYDRGEGKSFEVYSVESPEPGTWEVQIIPKSVPEEGIEVVFGFSTVPASE